MAAALPLAERRREALKGVSQHFAKVNGERARAPIPAGSEVIDMSEAAEVPTPFAVTPESLVELFDGIDLARAKTTMGRTPLADLRKSTQHLVRQQKRAPRTTCEPGARGRGDFCSRIDGMLTRSRATWWKAMRGRTTTLGRKAFGSRAQVPAMKGSGSAQFR